MKRKAENLSEILPAETVHTLLKVYRKIKQLSEYPDYSGLPKKNTFPKTFFKKIIEHLNSLQKAGWLTEQGKDNIVSSIINKLDNSEKGKKLKYATLKEGRKKREKITRPTNTPLDFLINFLAIHLEAESQKKNKWKLICDFLEKEKIINEQDVYYDEENIRDRFRKLQASKFVKEYEFYREMFYRIFYPESKIGPLFSERDIYLYNLPYNRSSLTLPDLPDLMPKRENLP